MSTGSTTFDWIRGELICRAHYRIPVYLAINSRTGEMMAVKQVEIRSGEDDDAGEKALKTLQWELEVLKGLDHPNIVQYFGFEHTASSLSVFLEYMPGGSISDLLARYGKFPDENLIKSFTSQILDGLKYLHSQGIVHLDLKGDNILVGSSRNCKIAGFEVSRRESYSTNENGANNTDMLGTIFWMAPEVVNPQGKRCDVKADVWSLGCVLLEMWTGERPWMGEEMVAVMFKLYSSKLPPPLPEDLVLSDLADDFRKQCFVVDPDQRPSAAELRNHGYLELPPGWVAGGLDSV